MKLPERVTEGAVPADAQSTFHFDLDGDGGGQFTADLKDGKLEVTEGHNGESTCVISGKADKMMDVVSGRANPMMAVMTGQIKISNMSEMMKYAKVLGLM